MAALHQFTIAPGSLSVLPILRRFTYQSFGSTAKSYRVIAARNLLWYTNNIHPESQWRDYRLMTPQNRRPVRLHAAASFATFISTGIALFTLCPSSVHAIAFFSTATRAVLNHNARHRLMHFDRNSVIYAARGPWYAAGSKRAWFIRRAALSTAYSTLWGVGIYGLMGVASRYAVGVRVSRLLVDFVSVGLLCRIYARLAEKGLEGRLPPLRRLFSVRGGWKE